MIILIRYPNLSAGSSSSIKRRFASTAESGALWSAATARQVDAAAHAHGRGRRGWGQHQLSETLLLRLPDTAHPFYRTDSPGRGRIGLKTGKSATASTRSKQSSSVYGFDDEKLALSPHELSVVYQLRLNLAKVLAGEPDCLLLDEPTNYLDIVSILGSKSSSRNGSANSSSSPMTATSSTASLPTPSPSTATKYERLSAAPKRCSRKSSKAKSSMTKHGKS